MSELRGALTEFAAERDWEQFHSPRNLTKALSFAAVANDKVRKNVLKYPVQKATGQYQEIYGTLSLSR